MKFIASGVEKPKCPCESADPLHKAAFLTKLTWNTGILPDEELERKTRSLDGPLSRRRTLIHTVRNANGAVPFCFAGEAGSVADLHWAFKPSAQGAKNSSSSLKEDPPPGHCAFKIL